MCVKARTDLRIAAAEYLDAALTGEGEGDEMSLLERHMVFLKAWQYADSSDAQNGQDFKDEASKLKSDAAKALLNGSKDQIASIIRDPIIAGAIAFGGWGNARGIIGEGTGLTRGSTGGSFEEAIGGPPGTTQKVDVSRAIRGTPEYDLLNDPPANTTIELSNGTTFRTNSGGYVEGVTYQPLDSSGVRDSRQTAVGKEGIAGDVGGHIQACRFGGTCDRFNLFPQNSNFNNGAYKSWENEISGALKNGDDVGTVTVTFSRTNPNSARPDSLEVEYTINGMTKVKQFENKIGGGQ